MLLQGYPNLENIVTDGGSTDDSVEIIKKYDRWLTCWVSETDKGQGQAINKGLSYGSGEVFNWLNSDDQLLPGALQRVAEIWQQEQPHLASGCTYDRRTVPPTRSQMGSFADGHNGLRTARSFLICT